jgi:MscS family membrane protein
MPTPALLYRLRCLIALLAICLLAAAPHTLAQPSLAPPDTSSPRATLQSLQQIMSEYGELLKQDIHTVSDASKARKLSLEAKAAQCLDLSQVPRERVEDVGGETMAILQEILDRIELPNYANIPDAAQAHDQKLSRWTIPNTEITLEKMADGPFQGQWLFSAETVARTYGFFILVRQTPYRDDAVVGEIRPGVGLYEYQAFFPEESFPSEWIDELPRWLTTAYFENPVWKWIAIALTLLTGSLVFTLCWLWARHASAKHGNSEIIERTLWMLPPAIGWCSAKLADEIIDEQVNAAGSLDMTIEVILWSIALLCSAWFIISVGRFIAARVSNSSRFESGSANHYLTNLAVYAVSITIAAWIVLDGLEGLGISLVPLVAGLGVGGLAIALAVRPTLENFIGGITLYIDKPVAVGDICRFGDEIGCVETIGIRTTRIRKYQDTIVSLPNSVFSQMQLENLSAREKTLFQVVLSLRYETSPDSLRYVLAKLREMLLKHPKVASDRLRVRFFRFGDSSLDIEVFAYIRTSDYPDYLTIREDINLMIMDVIKSAGTGFAFPSLTTYINQDSGIDAGKNLAAEVQVQT